MANHKSAVKRNKQSMTNNLRNVHARTTMRNLVKNLRLSVSAGDKEAALANLAKTVPYIDQVCTKGIIHKATASRKIGRLTKLVNSLG